MMQVKWTERKKYTKIYIGLFYHNITNQLIIENGII